MKTTLFLVLGVAVTLVAAEVKITLPAETGTYKNAPGLELMQANCLICHSTEYVSTQPPMPRKFWEATVKKMKDKYGAPIQEVQMAALTDYLTSNYGVPAAK